MRQTTVMIKNLLFTFSILLGFLSVNAQIDYLGSIDPDRVLIECDNNSGDDAIQDIIDSQIAGNNPLFESSGCDPVDVNITHDYSNNMPYACGDIITVTFDLEDQCANTATLDIDFEIEDTMDPTWPNDPPEDPNPLECDGTFNLTEINTIVNTYIADGMAGDAEDNCTASADLVITSDWDDTNPSFNLDCSAFTGERDITFTVTDECGLTAEFTMNVVIEDTTSPEDHTTDGSLDDPNETAIPCDILNTDQEIQDWIDDILVNGANTTRQFFSDVCTDDASLVISLVSTNFPVPNPPVGLDYTVCVEDASPYEAVFNVDDGCGNDLDFTFTFDIEDATEPDWVNGDNFYDTSPFITCEYNVAGVDHDADYAAWVANIINSAEANGEVTDECTAVGSLVITADPPTINFDPTSCESPPNIIFQETVVFTATDLCGNTATSEHLYTIEDVTDPVLDFSGWSQTTIPDCDDFASIEAEVTNVLLNGGVLTDDCSDLSSLSINDFNVTPDHTSLGPGDLVFVDNDPTGPPACYEIEFQIDYEDACGSAGFNWFGSYCFGILLPRRNNE